MFQLPREIQEKIYEYDPTYRQAFNEVLEELIPEEMKIIQKVYRKSQRQRDDFCAFVKDGQKYHVKFEDGFQEYCEVIRDDELRLKVDEYVKENIEYCSTEFLARKTNLTKNAIEVLRDNLGEEEFRDNMKRIMKDWYCIGEEAIEIDGAEHYIECIFYEADTYDYDWESDSYVLFYYDGRH